MRARLALQAWLRAQEAAVKIPQEEATVPGESPGIYGCDYQTLARISVLHAEARMALLHREPQVSNSSALSHWHAISC